MGRGTEKHIPTSALSIISCLVSHLVYLSGLIYHPPKASSGYLFHSCTVYDYYLN